VRTIALLAALTLSGCQCVNLPAIFRCDDNGGCPTGSSCRAGWCELEDAGSDAGADGGHHDAGMDGGATDAGSNDGGGVDGGENDAGEMDAGGPDGGEPDAGPVDAGQPLDFTYAPSNVSLDTANFTDVLTIDCPTAVFDTSLPGFTSLCAQTPNLSAFIVQQPGAIDLVVLPMTLLDITATGTLRVIGPRGIVFLVKGDAKIAGVLDARSSRLGGVGAGANDINCGARGGGNGGEASSPFGGGGGGAFATGGTPGGTSTSTNGPAGLPAGNDTLIPLQGGCPGGNGGGTSVALVPGAGGSGGGAIQISVAGTLAVDGMITVSGEGGQHGISDNTGGGGAGSGGGILLEGASVVLATTARLTANAGGGGEGGGILVASADGADGAPDTNLPAAGGLGAGAATGAGAGGNGASSTTAAGLAGDGTAGGGGGGGGLGRVRINGNPGCTLSASATVSAQYTANGCH
jgi:hypothetical protein